MKKILISLMAVALVVGLVGVGITAQFNDTETSSGNTFTAGTLDLKVDGKDDPDVATYFSVANVKPGDSGEVNIMLSNVGTIDGIADIHIIGVADSENGLTEPEVKLGDTEPEGELCDNLWIVITADLDGDGTFETAVAAGYRVDIECKDYIIGALNGVSSITVKIAWSVAADVGNIIQSDYCEFDIEFSLDQA